MADHEARTSEHGLVYLTAEGEAAMRRVLFVLLLIALFGASAGRARADDFLGIAQRCAPQVDAHTLAAIVSVESGYNPYAIGVVGGHLVRQPRSLAEALATVDMLTRLDYNFSLGLAQVNRYNLARFRETAESIFEPCANLRAAGAILSECFARAARGGGDQQFALRQALSCFYSGDFSTGFKSGYVEKVVAHADVDVTTEIAPIPLAGAPRAQRRPVAERAARAAARPERALAQSHCSPGIVIVSECESDGLANGAIKIPH
ncbi:lytic transglycosylase domain-containing protein [Paraburkholderia sediminicola]|uniref:lytic transglycosylase domain-containing protein n=1 Tax=Paraburkholderia sediminicola TaxID=458836 RepID=UPI0038BCA919